MFQYEDSYMYQATWQHLKLNSWKDLSKYEAELKKSFAYKKRSVFSVILVRIFFRIRIEYGEILNAEKCGKNAGQNNYEYELFLWSELWLQKSV